MRKLDLNAPNPSSQTEVQSSSQATADQPAVDAQTEVSDNQNSSKSNMKKLPKPLIIAAIIAIVAGVGTGYAANSFLKGADTGVPESGDIQRVADSDVNEGDVFGSPDAETFKDSAEGYLESGGLDGEGSHKLLRPGGDAQTVYLTSSVTDLDKLVGMEVQVWGETYKGQKAGWLMDVGRVKVVKVDGVNPVLE